MPPPAPAATPRESQAWHGSQHDQAMQEATPATVLGDFDDATFTQDGVTSRFYRKGEDFFVETDGPDGAMHPYRVDYTFGVYPLQQYLVAFPGGRFQALPLAWDTRAKEAGRPALVPPLSRRADRARRRAALDRDQSELELDVRRLPLDQPGAQL